MTVALLRKQRDIVVLIVARVKVKELAHRGGSASGLTRLKEHLSRQSRIL
jgi:hypothetical protein